MVYILIGRASRLTGVTPAAFQKHYEEKHMPLLQAVSGDTFPVSHTRQYVIRKPSETASTDTSNAAHPAGIPAGSQSDFPHDVIVELVFNDEEHCRKFMAKLVEPETRAKVLEDEKLFLDSSTFKIVAVSESMVTKPL